MSEVILGIDLGTTNSAVGVVDSGFPILLANEDNERIIPSAVFYGEEITVGKSALRRKHSGTGHVVTSVKRLIGQRHSESFDFPLPIAETENGLVVQLGATQKTPVEVSADILRELKTIAENRLGHSVEKAVVTVPAYFNDSQRSATKKAGSLAGLDIVRIVSEPTAAALAFGLDKLDEKSKVVVYDLGGGTFDVSLLELNNGVFQVEATSGDTQLGGDDFDRLIAEWVWRRHSDSPFEELSLDLQQIVTDASKKAKESLSSHQEAEVAIPFFRGTENIQEKISRDDFSQIAKPLIKKTLKHCRRVLLDSNITDSENELSAVVLVGGSIRIPAVRNAVSDFFNKEVDLSQHPDEAVALGAVIQAGMISGALRDIVLLDVTPLSLGVETYGGLMNVIIPRNTTIPCKAGEMFTNAVDQQKSMSVRVLQGEREMAKDNWLLGKIAVPFEADRKGQARVGVQFSIDENGILEVLTRDTATNIDSILKIESAAVDVEDAKVEEMVSESVEHAFEDMAERIFTEAKLKADELLPAVEIALVQVGELLEKKDTDEIRNAKVEVERAIDSKDANSLKAAVQKLDKSTEYLATLLVEKAMEDALLAKLND